MVLNPLGSCRTLFVKRSGIFAKGPRAISNKYLQVVSIAILEWVSRNGGFCNVKRAEEKGTLAF